jgi:biopolymer transport protein ExbD
MRRIIEDSLPLRARINVTPIIDVSLTLVIILLVTAPMMAVPEIDIKLPAAKAREHDSEGRVSVTVGTGGEIAINEQTVRPGLFLPTLKSILAKEENDGLLVVVRADQEIPYTVIEEILSGARTAGASRIAIATLQDDKVKR